MSGGSEGPRSWAQMVGAEPEGDRWFEAVALTSGAIKLHLAGDLEVAVRAILEHLDARGECDRQTGRTERPM